MNTDNPSQPSKAQKSDSTTEAGSTERNGRRYWTRIGIRAAAFGSVLLLLLWLVLAQQAGFIFLDREGYAASPDDPDMEAFSREKQYVLVGDWNVAYIDKGQGDPVLLLHGCPFHSFEWRDIIPELSRHYRVVAPDLLGLGDTQVTLMDDYRLPKELDMVTQFMDKVGIESAYIVGHDHGAATLQLMMGSHPERIRRAVLTNAEAYDQWPSKPEIPYLKKIINPVTSPVFRFLLANSTWVQQDVFSVAVHQKEAFSDEVVAAFTRAHTSTPARWQRLVRFFTWQLDPEHNAVTMAAVEGMRRFDKPTLMLWGRQDTNFGSAIAERLAKDIPGTVGIEWLENSAHMPFQEEPEAYVAALLKFFEGGYDDSRSEGAERLRTE